MKERLKLVIIAVLLIFGLSSLQAQTAIPATGGEANGSGGTISYTVGQVVYTTNIGTSGSVAQGVQQAFEISIETGIEQKGIDLKCIIYPNPVTDYLILTIDASAVQTHARASMIYQLFDTKGQMIETEKIITAQTKIKTDKLTQGNYLLRVIDNDKAIKTFKIIKH